MTETWGRSDTAGRWFPPRPIWTIAAFVTALLAAVAVQAYQIAFSWTPLQRWYLSAYVKSGVIGGLGVTATGHASRSMRNSGPRRARRGFRSC